LRAVVYLSLLGKKGLKDLAVVNLDKAAFTKELLEKIPGVIKAGEHPFFNEFPVLLSRKADEVVHKMIDKGYIPGLPLGRFYKGMDRHLLVAVTELRTKEDIVKFAESMEAVLCS